MSPLPGDRSSRIAAWLAVLVLTGAGGIAMAWYVDHHSLVGSRWHFIALLFAWVPLWLIGAWAATRLPVRLSVTAVLILSLLIGLAAASWDVPSISSDVYRYAWDAHVQLSGIDPYRYAPDAPQLRSLRTSGFFPTPSGCAALGHKAGCSLINHVGDRTIYPAVAEAWFVGVHLLTPGDAGSRPWQLTGAIVDVAVVGAMLAVLRQRGRDVRLAAWYALCPLPAVELAANGHVDYLALLALLGAVLALNRRLRVLAGVLVGLAIMVKLYPVLVLPAGWRQGRWRFVLSALAVCVATETPHVIAVGVKVIGYIPGYLSQEQYSSGKRFLLLGLLHLPGTVTLGLAVTVVVGLAAYVWRAHLDPATGFAVVLVGLMVVTTSVQPWYAVAIAGVATAAGRPWALAIPLAAEPYYAAVVLPSHHHHAALIGEAGFALATVILVGGWWYQRRRELRRGDKVVLPDLAATG